MAIRSDSFDLGSLRLHSGEGRRLALAVSPDPFELAGERYVVEPEPVEANLEISRTTGDGYALRIRFTARLSGRCMRCLTPAAPPVTVDAWEISQPGVGEELESPFLEQGVLDVRRWAHDALALALPTPLLCEPSCPGLCPVCGVRLADAEPGHAHERGPDPRWAKLSELRFDA